MSIANLFAFGRQAVSNIYANTIILAGLTSTERNALTSTDGTLSYDTTSDKLYVRANGSWEQVQSSAGSSSMFALFGPTALGTIPNGGFVNALVSGVTTVLSNGITINPLGYAEIPASGYYKVYAQAVVGTPASISNGSIAISISNDSGTVNHFKSTMMEVVGAASTASQWTMSTQGIVQLNAGDRITMYIQNIGSGSTLTMQALGGGPRLTYITIENLQ